MFIESINISIAEIFSENGICIKCVKKICSP